ncbi:ubiquinol-cytochrome c reductase iron-sulfur subunit [Oceanospirillaceae bacterium]|jgi:ubiquinol-cytochrome c reductase iron-sulfur subunit|uniref:ubiquinol-cytochrome c reductase iron-sulfur subunit n=1 Tax=Candidatus Njordibacter sp. Uisw_002 TaxID=3230971 RepID=UPI00236DB7CB|nr:ubiquinol-cytochrome c reductase iron-sulfur subunit [Oceanospirillaceae bacterium]MDC1341800.1 ubiquinol-cytochrome c reductase iron-sulfur subunit [Oceanospirillaceae bacterium]|tara:strand:- start:2106 stop:2702 length:597 start_codon:yes stop_codon:yes gene_type:complete
MSNEVANPTRRRVLVGASLVVGAVGGVTALTPFVASWNPSAKARAAGAAVKADISKLEPGQQMIVAWRGKPVWIVRRSAEALANLDTLNGSLADPDSFDAKQPTYVPNTPVRSLRDEVIVMIGLCTHLGCSPTYNPEVVPTAFDANWQGGFYCPCHGSTFDLSGRVYKGKPAPTNLEIPPHFYESDTVILIGEDGGNA